MKVSGIAIIICTVMLAITAFIPTVYAEDRSNQSVSEVSDVAQLIPLRSVISTSSESWNTSEQGKTSGSGMLARSYAMSGESSVPVDMAGIEWQKMLGGSWGDIFFDIQPTNDGNYIAAGASGSWDIKDDRNITVPGFVSYAEAWITKIDPTGKILWEKLIGARGYDQAMSIRNTPDGGYVFAGLTNSTDGEFAGKNHGGYDGWVVKLYSNGTRQWQTLLGGSHNDGLYSIRETLENDGYIVTGYTESSDIPNAGSYNGNTDIYVAKINLTGGVVWQKVIGGSDFDSGSSIIPASDEGYILVGYTASPFIGMTGPNYGNTILLMKLDNSGNPEWTKLLGGKNGEATAYGNAIQPTQDGGYILTGQTLSSHSGDVTGTTHGSADVWVVKLFTNGTIQWQNLLGGTGYDDGTAIQQTSHGDYILAGRTTSSNSGDVGQNNGGGDIWVVKLDSTGNLLWQDVLGGNAYDQCTAILPTPNEGFILAGDTESSNSGNIGTNKGYLDAWIAKLKPRLVVDVEDSSSHSWVPNATVFLHDVAHNEDQNLTALINGRVVFTGSGMSDQYRFNTMSNYTVRATADKYRDSPTVNVVFGQDGQRVILNQTPLIPQYNNSFSITCIENYDNICGNDGVCSISGSIDECNNVASALIKAGYKMNFYHKDGEVTEKDFATDPSYTGHNITESAFHYHTGHGTDPVVLGTYLNLKDSNIEWLPGIPPIPFRTGGYIDAGKVEKKWGGNTKWVALQSCKILKDENWGKALTTSHGILGYSTSTGVNSSFSSVFLGYALDKNKKMTIVSAYKQATLDTWSDDNITAAVITKTKDQYDKDQFPGIGDLAADGDPNSNGYYVKHWTCRRDIEW
jgi:hypothetical protein